jgi:hypothetical protein
MERGDEALIQSVEGEGEECLGELTGRRFGRKTGLFWPPTMNGGGRVFTRVDEVGQPWRKKGGGRRSSGGERPGLLAPFVPTGWWEVTISERGVTEGGDESMSS